MSLSSSPFDFGRMAMDSTGSSGADTGMTTGVPLGARVSPVSVFDNLGTATRSPAWALDIDSVSLPRSSCKAWRRSSPWVRGFVSTVSGRMVPDTTRRSEILPM